MMNPTDAKEISARIRSVRISTGMTQQEFAKRIEVSQSYLSEVEAALSNASLAMIFGIAHAFSAVSLRWLLTGETK